MDNIKVLDSLIKPVLGDIFDLDRKKIHLVLSVVLNAVIVLLDVVVVGFRDINVM